MVTQSESLLDLSDPRLEEPQQVLVADVARGDNQQTHRGTSQQMAIAEVRVLGDDHPTLLISHIRDPLIAAPVALRKQGRMEHVMTEFAQPGSETDG